MTKDEPVDGAAIAARILENMPQSHREKILDRMKAASPKSTACVKEILTSLPGQSSTASFAPISTGPAATAALAVQIAAVIKKMLASDEKKSN